GEIAGLIEADSLERTRWQDAHGNGPVVPALDVSVSKMFVKAGAKGHEGGEKILALAALAKDLAHDGAGDSLRGFPAAAAHGFDGADPGDALARQSRSTDVHRERQAGRRADRLALWFPGP